MNIIKAAALTMRPAQWIKNLFVFLPLFFSGRITQLHSVTACVVAFIAFCLASSSVYCFNDVKDIGENRRHPVKKFRPVASGELSVRAAVILSVILAVGALAVSCLCCRDVWQGPAVVGAYLIINFAYCIRIKQVFIADVICIATGFVLRVVLGGLSAEVWLSQWIICMTFMLTLFIGFAKRRDDVLITEEQNRIVRESTSGYNIPFMNQTLGLLGTITVISYLMYTMQPEVEHRLGCDYAYLTTVFVLAGILRYLQIALVLNRSGNPTGIALSDRFIQICVALWILSFILIIYL